MLKDTDHEPTVVTRVPEKDRGDDRNAEIALADPASVQLSVEKGLFFVEHQSMRWWKTKKCATCHEGQILLVAANVAKRQGVPIDQEKLDFWTERWVITDALVDYTDGRLNGLGWIVQDYRGRKVVLHGGAWGAIVAMLP